MQAPIVSFVIPCYRLAHFLAECVNSVLAQHYANLEIILLDDQSPDNTEEVAQAIISAHPNRAISYIRNATNLGNIRNYNKGISLATGAYVWILSPDDRLRNEDVVEKYVLLMEANPDVGFTFCAANMIENDNDIGSFQESQYRTESQIVNGTQIVKDIADSLFSIVAPSVLIRKECYERITLFPEDMPHRGDSYVWAMIAMKYNVGYFAEAMVDYRIHSDSMMSTLGRERIIRIIEDDIAVPWRIKSAAERKNATEIVDHCFKSIARTYAHLMSSRHSCRNNKYTLTVDVFESSLSKWEPESVVRSRIREMTAGELYWMGIIDLCRGRGHRGRHALRVSFNLSPKLRVVPPARLLMKIPRFGKRIGLIFTDITGRLLHRFEKAVRHPVGRY